MKFPTVLYRNDIYHAWDILSVRLIYEAFRVEIWYITYIPTLIHWFYMVHTQNVLGIQYDLSHIMDTWFLENFEISLLLTLNTEFSWYIHTTIILLRDCYPASFLQVLSHKQPISLQCLGQGEALSIHSLVPALAKHSYIAHNPQLCILCAGKTILVRYHLARSYLLYLLIIFLVVPIRVPLSSVHVLLPDIEYIDMTPVNG